MKLSVEFINEETLESATFAIEGTSPDQWASFPEDKQTLAYEDECTEFGALIQRLYPGDLVGDGALYDGVKSKHERDSIPGTYEGVLSSAPVRFIVREV